MRRRPKSGNHTLECQIDLTLDVRVEGYCEPGYAPITNRAPEDCDPGCSDEVEDFRVYCKGMDITQLLSKDDIQSLKDDVMDDYIDYDDNDAAYEASVGK